nr:hypothetical protein [Candidatus Njordarchaeum guaymaensis]
MSEGGFFLPTSLSPQQEEELIEKIARLIVRSGADVPSTILLQAVGPFSYLSAHFLLLFLSPILPLFGNAGENIVALLSKRENLSKLIQRVEALKKQLNEERKAGARNTQRNWRNLILRLFQR